MTLNYREHNYAYTTGFWYLLKWALVQYFVLWSLVGWPIMALKCYIFDQALVPSLLFIKNVHLLKQMLDKHR